MMKKRAAGTMVGLTLGLAAILPGFTTVDGVDVARAQLQPAPSPVASPSPMPGQAAGAAQQPQALRGVQAVGNVADVLIVNTPALTNVLARGGAQQVLSRAEVAQTRIVNLGTVLNPVEVNALNQVINFSRELRRGVLVAQRVVRNDPQLQALLQRQNINPNQVVALDVVGEPTLFVFPTAVGAGQPRTQPSPQARPGITASPAASPGVTAPTTTGTPAPAASPAARPRG